MPGPIIEHLRYPLAAVWLSLARAITRNEKETEQAREHHRDACGDHAGEGSSSPVQALGNVRKRSRR
jgi:hypothetical protein